ncbi:hypothetical protein GCM10027417_30220 [Glutamicibacter endophyticus]
MSGRFKGRSVRPGSGSGADATSISNEFLGDPAEMPDWAKPDPADVEESEIVVSGERLDPSTVSFEDESTETNPPRSVDELREAMRQIMDQPPTPRKTKKELKEERKAQRQAQRDLEPDELTDDQWREKARAITLRQLTGSDKTLKQLKDKLLEKECPEAIADEVLERYVEVKLVDDERFAKGWVTARARSRGLARGAIRRELRTKGIDDELAAEALEQIDDAAEEERARELVRAKLRPAAMGDNRDKALRRLVGMLGRKGYNGGLAFRVAREEWDARFGEQHGHY